MNEGNSRSLEDCTLQQQQQKQQKQKQRRKVQQHKRQEQREPVTAAAVTDMYPLFLRFPDGTEAPFDAAATHGRGTHASLTDSFLSRQHICLAPVDGLQDVVMLTNLGRNREL